MKSNRLDAAVQRNARYAALLLVTTLVSAVGSAVALAGIQGTAEKAG